MPTVSIRVSERDAAWLRDEAARAGVSVSALVRERLLGSSGDGRFEEFERRLARLEALADGGSY